MTAKNETLGYREEQNNIIGQVRELPTGKVLPDELQDIFNDLNRAFYEPLYPNQYRITLGIYRGIFNKNKKVNWVMKTKLTSE